MREQAEQEFFTQCAICKYPSRTPAQLKRTSHGYCIGCVKVAYTEVYRKMVEEGKVDEKTF